MSVTHKWVLSISGIALLLWLGYLCLQPYKHTQERDEPPLDPLIERASLGEHNALVKVYQKYLAEKEFDLANYWLLAGALDGAPELIEIYIRQFRALSEEKKREELYSIHLSQATQKQKDALLQKLAEADPTLKNLHLKR